MEQPFQTSPLITKILKDKSLVHLDILDKSHETFDKIKLLLRQTQIDLKKNVLNIEKRLKIEFNDNGFYEAEFKIASDTLIFLLHSNIFIFDHDHTLWKTSYVHNNPLNSHCGMISVYNFLSDSFSFNRPNDIGYLIARIFINKDHHYFVEGKRQIGFLFNDFENSVVSDDKLKAILDSIILYCLDFDMYIPPFDSMNEITVQEILNAHLSSPVITGKRLGFRFKTDTEGIE